MRSIFKSLIFFFAILFSVSTFAIAEPVDLHGDRHEMGDRSMMYHEMEHPRMHGKDCERNFRWMKPHNAAIHFLEMKDVLNLDDKQVGELKGLRDAYRAENTVKEAKLKVAEEELKELLFEDTINVEKTEAKIKEIGGLKENLWNSFVRQLARIKTIVPKEKMKTLHPSAPMHYGLKME